MSGKRQNEEQFPEAKRPKGYSNHKRIWCLHFWFYSTLGHSESREPESKRSLRADYGTGYVSELFRRYLTNLR